MEPTNTNKPVAPKSKKKAAAKKKATVKKKATAKAKAKAAPKKVEPAESAMDTAPADLLDDMTHRASKLDSETAEPAAKELILNESTNSFELGAVLMEIRNRSLFPEGTDFKSWITDVLEFKYRKAAYLIEIYAKAKELGLKWEDVKHLGWSKLAKLSAILTAENHKKVLADVADMKLIEVEAYVKQIKAGEEKPTQPTGLTNWSAKLSDEQHELVEAGMEHAKQASNVETNGMALEYVVTSYLSTTGQSHAEVQKPQPDTGEAPTNEQMVHILSKLSIEVVAEIISKAHPGFAVYVDDGDEGGADAPDPNEPAAADGEL